jgi:MFS family permease
LLSSAALPWRARASRKQTTREAVRRLATSRFISMAGTDATGVAIGFALYAQTHSAQWLSLSLMATIGTAAVLAPLGGRAGDLLDRRKLMIAAELTSAALFVTLALMHTPVALLALGVLASAIGTLFGPASGAAIAHVAGEQHLAWANGIIATGSNIGKTAGRLGAGALIAAVGTTSVFVLDATTFLISALLIASVRLPFSSAKRAATDKANDAADSEQPAPEVAKGGGLRFMLSHPTLKMVVASACISTFATAFTMTAEVPLVFELGVGALGLGALTACWGAGMVFGSWYGGRVLHRGNEATGVLVGRLAMAGGVGLVAAAPSLSPMLVCYLLGGAGGGFMGVAAQSLIMRNAPDRMRARTLAAMEACRNVAFGLGVVGAGALVGLVGARPVYGAVGLVLTLGTLPVALLVMRLGGPRPLRAVAREAATAPATA